MGADALGKQELPPALLRSASLYADLPAQAVRIGEFQHVAALAADGRVTILAIGDVLREKVPGRQSADEITIFDSSGIALQDLFVIERILARAIAEGSAHSVPRGCYTSIRMLKGRSIDERVSGRDSTIPRQLSAFGAGDAPCGAVLIGERSLLDLENDGIAGRPHFQLAEVGTPDGAGSR